MRHRLPLPCLFICCSHPRTHWPVEPSQHSCGCTFVVIKLVVVVLGGQFSRLVSQAHRKVHVHRLMRYNAGTKPRFQRCLRCSSPSLRSKSEQVYRRSKSDEQHCEICYLQVLLHLNWTCEVCLVCRSHFPPIIDVSSGTALARWKPS